MALSGSVNFALTRDDLIKVALQDIGAIGDGDTPNATQIAEASIRLNMLIKAWQADGMQLWLRYYAYLLPITGVSSVSIGAEGTAHAVSSYSYTTTSAASSSGGSTVTLTTVGSAANGNVIGIELTDNTMFWTTINGAPAGSVVTLTSALTGNVASGASVYFYDTANKIKCPAEVIESFRRFSSTARDTPMVRITSEEYNLLGDKTSTGSPVQWFFDNPLNFGASGYPGNSDFYIWPRFDSGDNVIVIKYIKLIEDLDSSTDNPEFPQEWFLALASGLSWALSRKSGIPLEERKLLMQETAMLKEMALDNDTEHGSIYFSKEYRGE